MATEGKLILMALICCMAILLVGCKIKEFNFNPYSTLMQEILIHGKNDRGTSAKDSR